MPTGRLGEALLPIKKLRSITVRAMDEAMSVRFHICLWIAALLASCDKSQDSGRSESSNESNSRVERANRPPRENAPNLRQGPGEPLAAAPISRRELSESLAAAMKVASLEDCDKALAEVARKAMKNDPDIAAEALKQISTDGVEKIPLIQAYALRLMEKNPDAALAWAASLSSETERAAATEQIVTHLAESDPERAAKLLSKSGHAGTEFDNTSEYVLQRWVATTPSDAAAWVATFPSGDVRKAAVKTVVSNWLVADSSAAYSWIKALKNNSIRKEATRAMAEALANQPMPIRDALLESADSGTRSELEQQVDQITKEQEKEPPPSE